MSQSISLTCINCAIETVKPFILDCYHSLCITCAQNLRTTDGVDTSVHKICCLKCGNTSYIESNNQDLEKIEKYDDDDEIFERQSNDSNKQVFGQESNNEQEILIDQSTVQKQENEPPGLNKLSKYKKKSTNKQSVKTDEKQALYLVKNTSSTNGGRKSANIVQKPETQKLTTKNLTRKSIITLNQLGSSTFIDSSKDELEGLSICHKHQTQYTVMNITTNSLACIHCVFGSGNQNKNHHIVPIKEVQDNIIDEINKFKQESKIRLDDLEETLQTCSINDDLLQKTRISYQKQISDEFIKVYEAIKAKEMAVKNQMNEFIQEKIRENQTRINNFLFLRNYLIECKDNQNTNNSQSDEQIYYYNLSVKLKKICKNINFDPELYSQEQLKCLEFRHHRKLDEEINNICRFYAYNQQTAKLAKVQQQNNEKGHSSTNPLQQYTQLSPKTKTVQTKIETPKNTTLKSGQIFKKTAEKQYSKTPTGASTKINFESPDKKESQQSPSKFSPSPKQNTVFKFTSPVQNNHNQINYDTEQLSQSVSSPINQIYVNSNIFPESSIFKPQFRTKECFSILPYLKNKQTNLLYKLSHDGASSQIVHQKCDNKGPYIVFIEANNQVFGYYMPVSFISEERYSLCENCWIFSITNRYGFKPMKFPIKQDRKFIALYQSKTSPVLGSSLDDKQDLYINFDDLSHSCSRLGYAYQLPEKEGMGYSFLAGSHTFWKIRDIEIYQIVA